MIDVRKELAAFICSGDDVLNPREWLAQEVGALALKIPHLDEFSPQAFLPLAQLVATGESDSKALAARTEIEETRVDEYLAALCEFRFAERTGNGYRATPSGEQAFAAIGRNMVTRELFEMKRRLNGAERLHERLRES